MGLVATFEILQNLFLHSCYSSPGFALRLINCCKDVFIKHFCGLPPKRQDTRSFPEFLMWNRTSKQAVKNILTLLNVFNVLTTRALTLENYHQKLNVWAALRVAERLECPVSFPILKVLSIKILLFFWFRKLISRYFVKDCRFLENYFLYNLTILLHSVGKTFD